jgi:2,4-diketo-3-deoxy-L-fuconate hydrolase
MSDNPLGLGTFVDTDGARFPGLVVADRVLDLRGAIGAQKTTLDLLNEWDANLPKLTELARTQESFTMPLEALRPLPPVEPRQLLCAGANYFRHVREISFSLRKNQGDPRADDEIRAEVEEVIRRRQEVGEPFIFAGLVSAVCGANDDVVLWGPGEQHDWELELAVVIGRPARYVNPKDAMSYIAGYTIANDVSTRDLMNRSDTSMTDFIMTKSRPTFFPVGPYIVPREFVPNPRDLHLSLTVNGEVMQDESADDIIYGVEELVSYASNAAQLLPGDILLTGSPAGNAGHHGNRWLRPGDVMVGAITGLGSQHNNCVAPPSGPVI